jgi:hypothetical protein
MSYPESEIQVSRGAETLLRDHFCVEAGQEIVITTDDLTDPLAVRTLFTAAGRLGAKPIVVGMPRLPYQGSLADPFIPEAVDAAVRQCDVWLDLTFPYMAGSRSHSHAMQSNRTRYMLVGDLGSGGLARLYGRVDFDRLFDAQLALDRFFREAQGKECRVTCPRGSDFSFIVGRPATEKHRYARTPGSQTVPGSAVFYPDIESVRGVIALDAVFHEFFRPLEAPLFLDVEGRIRAVRGDSVEARVMERALRRAGGGDYGYVIHLSYGFHPTARKTGSSFIEDIRTVGSNAIGLGIPWWELGGGENHPDGVLSKQSLWVDGEQVIKDGELVAGSGVLAEVPALEPVYG